MTREQAKQNLIGFGIAEPTDEQITNYLNQIGSETKHYKDKLASVGGKDERIAELEKELEKINKQNMTDIELANAERDKALSSVANLEKQIPSQGYNHGFTFEGFAQQLFVVDNACVSYNAQEDRTFAYINPTSKLMFQGDPSKKYRIYFHIYENCVGEENNRWVVVNAEEL